MVTKTDEENENYYNFRNGQSWADQIRKIVLKREEKEEKVFLELSDLSPQKMIPEETEKKKIQFEESIQTKKKKKTLLSEVIMSLILAALLGQIIAFVVYGIDTFVAIFIRGVYGYSTVSQYLSTSIIMILVPGYGVALLLYLQPRLYRVLMLIPGIFISFYFIHFQITSNKISSFWKISFCPLTCSVLMVIIEVSSMLIYF